MRATPRHATGALLFSGLGALLFAASLLFFLYSYLVRFGHAATDGGTWPPVIADLALFTAFALHHSVFARTGIKQRLSAIVPDALERSLYVWFASALFLVVCAAWRPVPGELYRMTGAAAIAAYGVHIAGIVLTARGSARLDVLDLAGIRRLLTSDNTQHVRLQTGGVYGFVRHPVYFAWVLMVFGTPHMTMTRLTFAVISTVYLAIAIPMEERGLIRLFGVEYREYQRRVRWRMLPGVY
jgi:methanethiol S-methyltransferase